MAGQPSERDLLAPLLRRVFASNVTQVERVTEGVSTKVYRVLAQDKTFYLRILPEAGASFGPEVVAHERMRALGVNAPEVVFYEPLYEPLQRSVTIVTEIPGAPLSQSSHLDTRALDAIMVETGRDLARINSVQVDGFGWIARAPGLQRLRAPLSTNRAFMLEAWTADLAFLTDTATLRPKDVARLEQALAVHATWLDDGESWLAHGDFDATAVYQRDGAYTGVIDFGEMRGGSRWYDLAHFHMRDGEYLAATLLPPLLHGYADVIPLAADAERSIRFASLFINTRALSHSQRKRPPNRFTQHQVDVLRADLAALCD
ncbi:MAG TPA: phosphotransferase [Ktedonobacterales bacterium]|jgi:aminoglycoside phosphotransferase (APT) family kinase protein|nr:phosphotransferase [Ktedonobacterales bacterium]